MSEPTGDTADLVVVVQRHRAVAQQVQIRLDHVGALLDRERERLERVLELVHRRAAVRDVLHQRISADRTAPSARSTARSQPA